MDWREEYQSKLISAEEAAKLVRSGDVLAIGGSTDQPKIMQQAIFARRNELSDVKVFHMCPVSDPGWITPGAEDSFSVTITSFIGPIARQAVRDGKVDFVPNAFATHIRTYDRPGEERFFDVFVVTVSPPNKQGFCCFGPMLWFKRSWLRRARRVIAEIDPTMKWVYGDATVHVSEVDQFVEYNPPPILSDSELATALVDMDSERREKIKRYISLTQPPQRSANLTRFVGLDVTALDQLAETLGLIVEKDAEKDIRAIAGYLSQIIRSGDCFQVGVGSIGTFLHQMEAFEGKEDLGYHAELCPRGVATMVREGQINGRRRNFMPGKTVLSSAGGMSPEEIEFASENPRFEFYETPWVTRPDIVCQNDNMVAIQSGISIDLSGQINSETILGGVPVNGPGGQPESHIGAIFSRGGKGITLLRSTALGGAVSNIVPQLEPGEAVTIPRHQADYIITEYGIARLMGKSLRERANELIAIAHPDFRSEMRKAAQKLT